MKNIFLRTALALVLGASFALGPLSVSAAESTSKGKTKPYNLKTCIVSDEKLGDMGEPYVFTHKGQEMKLCCKSCLKQFNKDPEKYVKKLQQAEAKQGKKAS